MEHLWNVWNAGCMLCCTQINMYMFDAYSALVLQTCPMRSMQIRLFNIPSLTSTYTKYIAAMHHSYWLMHALHTEYLYLLHTCLCYSSVCLGSSVLCMYVQIQTDSQTHIPRPRPTDRLREHSGSTSNPRLAVSALLVLLHVKHVSQFLTAGMYAGWLRLVGCPRGGDLSGCTSS